MNRRVLFAALIVVGLLVSFRWPGRAQSVSAANAGCGQPCTALETQLRPLAAKYQRPTEIPYPEDSPFSAAKLALGETLFFDPILSNSRSTSCASCHNPGLSWGDGLPHAVGDNGAELPIRSPTLLNIAWLSILGWDGKFPALETMTFAPITGRANMALEEPVLLARLGAIPAYGDLFAAAFGDAAITRERIEAAMGTYERSLVSPPAPFDHWVAGDPAAIDDAAKRGLQLFDGRAGCAGCHNGWAFTDGSFHDIGSATGDDIGRGARFPSSVKLRYAFKVPTLRDAARRAPYMHDGSVATLSDVIDLYDKGGIERPSRSPKIKPLGLSAQDKTDLIAFLGTLTSFPQTTAVPTLPR